MDLSKLSDEDFLALKNNGLQAISNEGLKSLLQPTQQKPVMSNENPIEQLARGFSQRGKEAAVGLAELTGLVPESVSQNVRAEREWVKQRPMAQVGAAGADIAMTAPVAMVNPALAASIPGATALSGTQAYLTTPGNLNERNLAGATGMAGGALGAGIGKAIPYAATIANRMTAPFREGGREEIMSRLLQNVAGENAPSIASRLENPINYVKGSNPTAAEVGQSGGLSALQRWAEQANPEQYAFRRAENAMARRKAVDQIAGNDLLMDAAKGIRRSISNPLYEEAKGMTIPVDKELIGLLRRPSMGKALGYAEVISAEQGNPISQAMKDQILSGEKTGFISGEALNTLKVGLDAMKSDPKNPLSKIEQNALQGTIDKFEGWRETNIPKYAEAQNTYRELSKPINRMQVGQALSERLTPALAEGTTLTRENANAFANALRQGDLTAQKATGYKSATLENTLGPEHMATLEGVRRDLSRKASSEELGRGVGSNTFQNLAMQDLAQAAGYPATMMAKGINRIPLVGEFLTDLAEKGVETKNKQLKNELADVMLDPKRAAELLRKPESEISKFFKSQKYGVAPAVVGNAIANQIGE